MGRLRCLGFSAGRPWRIGIADPVELCADPELPPARVGERKVFEVSAQAQLDVVGTALGQRVAQVIAERARASRVYFYVDEFQSMMNEAFADILSESRKYKQIGRAHV